MTDTDFEMIAYELEEGDQVSCYFCMNENNGDQNTYGKGDAYLCESGCPPFDGNANYVCKDHLDPDIIIVTPTTAP